MSVPCKRTARSMSSRVRGEGLATMTLIDLGSTTRRIAICTWLFAGISIAFAVLPAYSWLSMTSFPDVFADVLTRMFGMKVAALLLGYMLGPLVSAVIGLAISLTVGLIVPQARSSTGLWMGLVAAVAYLSLAVASGVQPRLVTVLELSFLVGTCVVGLSTARWLWRRLGVQKAPTR